MNYIIRELNHEEYEVLNDFLYEAIFQREGEELLPRYIINDPALKIYIDGFGKKDDHALCAESDGKIVGVVWTRIIGGYGSIDKTTLELAVSIYKEYRGYGIGTELMKKMLLLLKEKGYEKVSLAVQKDNYAYKMYKKIGFEIVDENEQEYIMKYNLN